MTAVLSLVDATVVHGTRIALRGLSATIGAGESLGLVGRSGSGKSTAAGCLAGLLRPTSGEVVFEGRDVRRLTGAQRRVFHRAVQLVPQDCPAALDRWTTVAEALTEPALVHGLIAKRDRDRHVRGLLDLVRLPAAVADRYPDELSGGQAQRVVLGRALGLRPRVLIADESVSALDVSTRAQVVNLMTDLRDDLGLALVFVDHDLPLVCHVADRLLVLHGGGEIARGTREELRASPHPAVGELFRASELPPLS
ncbi:dipeptide/oligopeptide/nickel ABC transporter ATP-binding protein [Umezawaea sp. Da 62-37]|uniref:ABC transporter ATP-binding protein n=1 Tax=Umezawaea sp. Da 62-37 TaxID=3075927 RepID=UPI0028F72B76|nr:dipeptide/oligopeptide/nickel ABC transporter ATP-binding protein [Umezawaea sp. Da 62-37]WNV87945.1 dipeptide/oligopeptide/nickel ABC transporter ATP-binding protein [Umezawaea sp. Da 62-37]